MGMNLSQEQLNEAYNQLYGECAGLVEKYNSYIDPIKEVSPGISDFTVENIAIVMENLDRWLHNKRMDETTTAVNVGSFINYGFELLAAMFPALIANDIVSVQPMTRRVGEIFFMEFLYGTTKGNITKGQKMFSFETVGNKNTYYTGDFDITETIGTGDAATKTFNGFLNNIPMVAGSVVITDGVETFSEPVTPDGTLSGDLGGSGTINSNNGAFSVTFNTAPVLSQAITATWNIDYQKNTDLIPEVDISITSSTVTATNRKLRAKYSLDAAYDVEQGHGRSIDNELKVATASEVRMETDSGILNQLYAQGTATATAWSRTPPSTAVAWADHKWSFYDQAILQVKNDMFEQTRKVEGNFIVAGSSVASVIESLAPIYKSDASVQPGPHYMGMLGDFRVYKNPMYDALKWLMGYKGSMFLEAGFVWAPYLPLYVSRTIVLDDLLGRFGMMQSDARKMVNSLFYSPNIIS
jgi:hypothetical protein